jgi:hypothetical protein
MDIRAQFSDAVRVAAIVGAVATVTLAATTVSASPRESPGKAERAAISARLNEYAVKIGRSRLIAAQHVHQRLFEPERSVANVPHQPLEPRQQFVAGR